MKFLATLMLAFATFISANSAAYADNVCKPKDTKACQQAPECYWVKGYTNTKSEMIKGHCRTKPGNPKK